MMEYLNVYKKKKKCKYVSRKLTDTFILRHTFPTCRQLPVTQFHLTDTRKNVIQGDPKSDYHHSVGNKREWHQVFQLSHLTAQNQRNQDHQFEILIPVGCFRKVV